MGEGEGQGKGKDDGKDKAGGRRRGQRVGEGHSLCDPCMHAVKCGEVWQRVWTCAYQKRSEMATPPHSSPMTKKMEKSQLTAMPASPTRP